MINSTQTKLTIIHKSWFFNVISNVLNVKDVRWTYKQRLCLLNMKPKHEYENDLFSCTSNGCSKKRYERIYETNVNTKHYLIRYDASIKRIHFLSNKLQCSSFVWTSQMLI